MFLCVLTLLKSSESIFNCQKPTQ